MKYDSRVKVTFISICTFREFRLIRRTFLSDTKKLNNYRHFVIINTKVQLFYVMKIPIIWRDLAIKKCSKSSFLYFEFFRYYDIIFVRNIEKNLIIYKDCINE